MMNTAKINRTLIQVILVAGLGFLMTGVIIQLVFPIPSLALLIDRSYCSTEDWQKVSQPYEKLYRSYEEKNLNLKPVILFSSLGEEVLDTPPKPVTLQSMNTYGKPDLERRQKLQQSYPQAQFLSCY